MRAIKFLPVFFLALALLSVTWTGFAQYGRTAGEGSAPAPSYTLTVSKSGLGTGTVTGTVGRATVITVIDCGSVCTYTTSTAATVNLTATAAPGSAFAGWSGSCSGTGACSVTLASNVSKLVTATFNKIAIGTEIPLTYTLTLTKGANGKISSSSSAVTTCANISAAKVCTVSVSRNIEVSLTALPNDGYEVDDWSGCSSVAQNTCKVLMSGNKTATVSFKTKPTTALSCLKPDGTTETFGGHCEENTAIWCENDILRSQDCRDFGSVYTCQIDRSSAALAQDPRGLATCFEGPKLQCSDGIDNDGDGKIDYPADPGCTSASDNSEADVVPPTGECPLYALYGGGGRENYLRPGIHKIKPWLKPNIVILQNAVNAYAPLPTAATYPPILGKSLAKLAIDGLYGGLTLDAVWEYQYRNGLKPDRIVGPLTTAALHADYLACSGGTPPVGGDEEPPVSCAAGKYHVLLKSECGTPEEVFSAIAPLVSRQTTIKSGSALASSPSAAVAAKLLRYLDYASADYSNQATWDSALTSATITFQLASGLTGDGFLGRLTRTALIEKYLVQIGLLAPGARLDEAIFQ